MDSLGLPDCFDSTLVGEPMEPVEMSEEDEALIASLVEQAKKLNTDKATLRATMRASRRKKEDPKSGPSEKISIRLPRPLLTMLRQQARLLGIPYQTYIKTMLHDVAIR
ncbi:CopG family antitoxin [Ferribacterium limneticum]|uniref:CopG family antitoxin n=1 Tax=Ferribacterium limneticum TaxID=76259 RepID=UPI001CF8EE02|nr:CopG family antitoxin [Ferribacterium limneticum]UCV22854.1 hypothetical protein KI613_20485 [Ferribacterium limneticum]